MIREIDVNLQYQQALSYRGIQRSVGQKVRSALVANFPFLYHQNRQMSYLLTNEEHVNSIGCGPKTEQQHEISINRRPFSFAIPVNNTMGRRIKGLSASV